MSQVRKRIEEFLENSIVTEVTEDVQTAVYSRDLSAMGGAANGINITCINKSISCSQTENRKCTNYGIACAGSNNIDCKQDIVTNSVCA